MIKIINYKGSILFAIIGILLYNTPVWGCVGARPLGMGGAFIGIADDVETVYWNPAGLTSVEEEKVHITLTMNSRDQMGYRVFIGFNKKFNNFNLGLSYISRLRNWGILEEWYVVSLATKIPSAPALSVGVNGRYETHSNGISDSQLNLSVFWVITDRVSFGFLYQSLNNFRPGISYRISDKARIAIDIYNAFHNPDILDGESKIMYGLEVDRNQILIRLGTYAGDFTMGLSFSDLDIAVMFRDDIIVLLGKTFSL